MKKRLGRERKLPILIFTLLLTCAAFLFLPAGAYADEGLVITAQPQDMEVNYPDGASFHVEVADPASVASWQWIASDGYSEFVLTGTSALTDTLQIPSTVQDDPDMFYCCVITDKSGNTVTSDPVRLHIKNPEEDKTVLYVGNYAVEPGEKLDLSTTSLGSGIVDFAADGVNVTFYSIKIDNTVMLYDATLSPSQGLYLIRRNGSEQEYYLHFLGDCLVNNTYYDPEYNAAGVAVNSYFRCKGDPNAPTLIFDGDGKLTVKGGSNQIYSDGNIELAADITTGTNGTYFCDGISCRTLYIDENVHAKLNVNGTAIHTEGDLRIDDGAVLDVSSSTPHVSVGPTTKNMFFLVGSLYAKKAEINIKGYADPENFIPYHSYVATMSGIALVGEGNLNADGTKISIELSAGHADDPFAINFCGISGFGDTNAVDLSNGAKLDIRINTPEVNGVSGLDIPGLFEVEKGCAVNIDILGAGEVTGIEADRAIHVTDAVVESKVVSQTGDAAYGIVCGEAAIDLSNASCKVHSIAQDGIAFAADTGEHEDAEVSYESGYQAVQIKLQGGTKCMLPENSEINLCGVPGYGSTIKAETFYGSDTKKPAAEVLLSSENKNIFEDVTANDWFYDAVLWAVNNDVTKGTDETHFSPDLLCSRAQMVTFLWRAVGSPVLNQALPFTDVDQEAYYADAVRWATAEKIVRGTTETTFSPDDPVSREQLATFIYRYAQTGGEGFVGDWYFQLEFADAASVSSWADEGVHWCVMKGIINGVGENKIDPQGTASRAQIVTMLYRCFSPANAD